MALGSQPSFAIAVGSREMLRSWLLKSAQAERRAVMPPYIPNQLPASFSAIAGQPAPSLQSVGVVVALNPASKGSK